MILTEEQKARLEEIYQAFFYNDKIQKMKEVKMHRGSNCFEHSFKVAKYAIRMALRRPKLDVDLEVLLIGAILHDYYLYDWRDDRSKLKKHTSKHPYIAAENAVRDFGITPEIKKIIQTHMWPVNLGDFPSTKEARIVDLADNHVAFIEAMTSIKYKNKHRQKYLDHIAHLF